MTGSEGRGGTRVGIADVCRLEDVVAELRALDYRYGGGACRADGMDRRMPFGRIVYKRVVGSSIVSPRAAGK